MVFFLTFLQTFPRDIVFPSDFIITMNLRVGDEPKFYPHKTNPLSQKEWWKI